MTLTSLYRFKLSKAWLMSELLITPLGKAGNNKIFNELFTTPDLIKNQDIGSQDIIGNLKQRKVTFLTQAGKKRSIVFQLCDDYKENHGIIKVKDYGRDCYCFRMFDNNIFEVYIAENYGSLRELTLMKLCDGYLDAEIELLRKNIENAIL